MKTFFNHIDTLVDLRHIFNGSAYEKVRAEAFSENPWFTPTMIDSASQSICHQMLVGDKLREWLSNYQRPADFNPKRVGIIAAGNIPMVSFFDVLCAIVAGHNISFKPSSKDTILMEYVLGHLSNLMGNDIEIVNQIDRYDIDYLIATGSDSTASEIRQKFHAIPAIIRGSRHSIARLRGDETPQEIVALEQDIFLYYGLGCRNISHIIVPDNYDIQRLAQQLRPYPGQQFAQNAQYEKALLTMRATPFIEGNGFVFIESNPNDLPPIGTVGYSRYSTSETLDFSKIQCTVGIPEFKGNTTIGSTQTPSLTQYPDNIDVVRFLLP